MEIQQKDSETLTAYIHRFKKEAKHCDFDSHPAKIRIFLKGLINNSRIAPSVYEKGPTTIEDAIGIVEKIRSGQRIAASSSQNHQISMMKRGPNDHHTLNQDCSNCGQLGHLWFTCPHIICDGCNQCGPPAQTGTPTGTETQDGDTHQTATEPKANHPTDSSQVTIDHQLRTPGIILGVDHPHATMTSCIDVAYHTRQSQR